MKFLLKVPGQHKIKLLSLSIIILITEKRQRVTSKHNTDWGITLLSQGIMEHITFQGKMFWNELHLTITREIVLIILVCELNRPYSNKSGAALAINIAGYNNQDNTKILNRLLSHTSYKCKWLIFQGYDGSYRKHFLLSYNLYHRLFSSLLIFNLINYLYMAKFEGTA